MQIREYLTYMVRVNRMSAKGFIGDITEDESMNRIDGRFNHIRWLTGHCLYYASWILSQLDPDYDDHEKLKPLFAPGTTVSDNPDEYPAISEIRKQLDMVYDRVLNALKELPDADLEKEIGDGENKEPLWKSISFLCMHNFYHTGQIMYHRRGVGKKWPFGDQSEA